MKLVVAVSGGVDSVVLLDQLVGCEEHQLVVAHFDHGIRESSAADARFVEGLAVRYGLPFELGSEKLGAEASEDYARQRRYEFLFEVAGRYGAKVATAHHLDDVVETVALNIIRGTRWRGLAGMSDQRVWRPLTKRTKSELIEYAVGNRLEWVEDETNQSNKYARNKLRKVLTPLPFAEKEKIYNLWQRQLALRENIDSEIEQADFPVNSRYFIIMINQSVAKELLYSYSLKTFGVSLLSSQLEVMWMAVKVGRANTQWQIGQHLTVRLTANEWYAEMAK